MPKLTKRTVDAALPEPRERFIWCSGTAGFGVRIYPSGKKAFIAQMRVGRATRRIKIGYYGPFTVDQARTAAEDIIRVASLGRDPQRERREAKQALTVSELLDKYMEAARAGLVVTRFRVPKRQSTVAVDEGRVSRHLKPLIGSIPARELSRSDVQRMADQISQGKTRGTHKGKPRGKAVVRGGSGTAARVVELLGGVYSWAERRRGDTLLRASQYYQPLTARAKAGKVRETLAAGISPGAVATALSISRASVYRLIR